MMSELKRFRSSIAVQVSDVPFPHFPKRKTCIYVLNDIDYQWIEDLDEEPCLTNRGQTVRWSLADKRIELAEILQFGMCYALAWSKAGFATLPTRRTMSGVWKTHFGYIQLFDSGNARMKLIGKGTSTDSDELCWNMSEKHRFDLSLKDSSRQDRDVYKQTCNVSRFDGTILEIESVSGFNLDPFGFPEIQLWKATKGPTSWKDQE